MEKAKLRHNQTKIAKRTAHLFWKRQSLEVSRQKMCSDYWNGLGVELLEWIIILLLLLKQIVQETKSLSAGSTARLTNPYTIRDKF